MSKVSSKIALNRHPLKAWIVLFTAFGVMAVSCDSRTQELLAKADGLGNTTNPDSAAKAIDLYAAFVSEYPEREEASRALRTQARLTQQLGDMATALGLYEGLLARYPGSDYADEAQFMVGYIYEEHVRDLDQARSAYQKVIDHYPESELAVSARHLLPNVGRAAEEWLEFQEGVTTQ